MSEGTKIVKYGAMGLGILLALSIIFGSIYLLLFVFNILNSNGDIKIIDKNKIFNSIDIDLKAADLKIIEGNKFKIETDNKNLIGKIENQTLTIKDTKWVIGKKNKITITLPKNKNYENFNLSASAGNITIENINTNNTNIDLSAGNLEINYLVSNNLTNIDTGAGKVLIKNGTINNMDLDIGVGMVVITSHILGNSIIESSVGGVTLNILENKENYTIKSKKSIGSLVIDNEILDASTIGNGQNIISIDDNIGKININFKNKNI